MLRAIDVVRRVAPRAHPSYLAALEAGDAAMTAAGLTTGLRLAHFLAQVLHESGGLTVTYEDMRYRAPRILEIFGVGRHSAAVTPTQAKALAGQPEALAERVYGLGNPAKARELGNTQPGDGFRYRGGGLLQTTGREAYRRLGEECGLGDFYERQPDMVLDARYALAPALAEWRDGGCNAMADRNDIRAITRKINGGYNGLADRVAWFDRIWPLLREDGQPAESWRAATADDGTAALQGDLNALGYGLKADGRMGPATGAAVADFQRRNGLAADGIPGDVTRAALKARLAGAAAPAVPPPDAPPPGAAPLVAGGMAAGGAKATSDLAPVLQDQAAALSPYADLLPAMHWIVGGLTLAAAALVIYGLARQFVPSLWRRAPAVPR